LHIYIVEIELSHLPDDMVLVPGITADDTTVLELDALYHVDAVPHCS
jgi:hypothetical protein